MNSRSLSVLQVNHGYPERYNAGSEVYTRNLSHALHRAGHRVSVFAREEDPYRPDYELRNERDGDIPIWLVNMPRTQHRWQHDEVDAAFMELLERQRPDAVHFHHLNHISVGLPAVAARSGAAVIFTVHDFWLVCPRGQLVQWRLGGEPWPLCPGQDDTRCAESCFGRCQTGAGGARAADLEYWRDWVQARMSAVEAQLAYVDTFLCPSMTVARALATRFPQLEPRIHELDYGFPVLRRAERRRHEGVVFGYLGTHAATKGVDLLIRAMRRVSGDTRLRIYGRSRGQETEALRRLAGEDHRVTFEGEYSNGEVSEVLAGLDVVVVPSVWLENSPLVIHEAQQARRCVVTADTGGMAEYVAHEVNGLLFRHRDELSLATRLQRLVNEPGLAERLGARGYLHTPTGEVLSIDEQAAAVAGLYAAQKKGASHAA